ncbi:MAG TPA: hypothetical protein VHZ25_11615 [Acidobacteriaceae bacterium]|jgi:hypothetical protein|nr:hypothetical protein [Acidobacteriaceae bacterium]
MKRPAVLLSVATALGFTLLAGCGMANTPIQVGTSLSGNWAFVPASSSAVLNLGFTQGAYETVSAVARLSGASCISPTTNILLTGSVGGNNQMLLVSSAFNGTTLTLQGEVAGDGKGIGAASWTFAGGNCGTMGKANVTATQYSAINGTYTGTFLDGSANPIAVSALLEQTSQPDLDGQFSLSGTATFPDNSCFAAQPTLTTSLVTGSNLSMSYTDTTSGAVLTAVGTFNASASQLTITNWSITGGSCSGSSGTGTLTLQTQNL